MWTPQLVQINSPSGQSGVVFGKVLAANYTGQVYMWSDFNFVAPYNFNYARYPNDEQRVCYKFDDKRYFSVRFVVADEVKSRRREAITDTHISGWNVAELELTDSRYVFQVISRLHAFKWTCNLSLSRYWATGSRTPSTYRRTIASCACDSGATQPTT